MISSPGYPGVFLKNLNCRFRLENNRGSRNNTDNNLILINDNLQLDGKICHFNHTNKHLSSSFFCDTGTRSNINCLDSLNIWNSTGKFIRDVCGIGRMNKIVMDASALMIEFSSGSQGYFANTGFLFYALGHQEYLNNFEKYNDVTENLAEMRAIKQLDMLQVQK